LTQAARLALGSIGIGTLVFALKLLGFWVTGSVAILADAVESVVNIAAALAALVAIRVADRPADTQHPFGHHKAEFLSAVLEGVLIVLAALFILSEVYGATRAPGPLEGAGLGLALILGATVLNGLWSRHLVRRGTALGSPALVADGRHLWADVMTTLGVGAGLVLASFTGWWFLDPLIAALVALHVLWVGWRVMGSAVSGLMDEAVPPEVLARIRDTIRDAATGAEQVHDLKTRHAGRAIFIEFHLIVQGDMTVHDAHAICDRLEAALARALPGSQTVIHLEPGHMAETDGDLIEPAGQ
jgi:cation diffusion facilitator family transporter